MEALHARGFTTVKRIVELPEASFTKALVGTVAYPRAPDIYGRARQLPWDPDDDDTPPGTTFQPINSGSLIDCMPPCHLSPFSPVQYLRDLLELSDGTSTIRDNLKLRRGDLGHLLVTSANEDIPVPVVDIVNEALEGYAFGLGQEAYEAQVYNTLDSGLTALDMDGTEPVRVPSALSAAVLLRALPQHSTPHPLATPNIYEQLKTAPLRPELPYSQGLDIGRAYLDALGTSRFETLRTFQKDITELPQDAAREPAEFQRQLWRLPVRRDIAIEYLCMSAEEASVVFGGGVSAGTALQMLGVRDGRLPAAATLSRVTFFLEVTGLSYCEFLELHKSRIVTFRPDAAPATDCDEFPPCLPCCADSVSIAWDAGARVFGEFLKMVIFARLWRRLQGRRQGAIRMDTLADICKVLRLFDDANVNPDFLVQLSSLLMLKEVWCLPWTDTTANNLNAAQPDQQTQLLALWSGAGATTPQHRWAVEAVLDGVEKFSMATYQCPQRSASWRRIIAENLGELASLAGFDGTQYTWDSQPTCTIRFVEVLSKLYASQFTVGEILFIFTNKPHLRGDDPYPRTEEDESLDDPLNVPEDDAEHGLWSLRRKLLDVRVSDEDAWGWTWARMEAALRDMGFGEQWDAYGNAFGEHFFPEILAGEGQTVPPSARRFETRLPTNSTNATVWTRAGESSPFHADLRAEPPPILWTCLPLRDDDVLRALRHLRQLNAEEQGAVRTLYLAPRAMLTPFAFLFDNFGRAAEYMIQEPSAHERWRFFQREVVRFLRRCRVVAHHIHDAVVAAARIDSAGCSCEKGEEECAGARVAWAILVRLAADGNRVQNGWEDDSGIVGPDLFDLTPHLTGGAFAALLGLAGTGLLGEYTGRYGASWTETRGGLSGWGAASNDWNAPVPTVLPRMDIVADQGQSIFASFKNGFALDQDTGDMLTGAEPFTVTWSGVLLVETDGCYRFAMRCPKHPGDDDGACHCEKHKRWSVTLQRGQKTWHVLERAFSGDDSPRASGTPASRSKPIPLRRGGYDLVVRFRQPEPDFDDDDDLGHFHTGFLLQYTGPDTGDCLVEVPHTNLYLKDRSGRIGYNNEEHVYFHGVYDRYLTSLRDARRTYERAFKAVLFAHRFCLSASQGGTSEWETELGYLLSHADLFRGVSYYYRDDESGFHAHRASLDFNLLPIGDAYAPPGEDVDQRVEPSWKRSAALFDWFERIFDYARLRRWVREVCEPPVWLLFHHAYGDAPQPVAQLVRFLDVDIALARLALEYFEPPDRVWAISDDENVSALADERWATRVWLAGRYLERLKVHFYAPVSELVHCRPALWAANPDGNAATDGSTGNANLMRFVQRSALSQTDAPPRLPLVVALNNGLRLRARTALLAFLAAHNHSAADMADRLLLDVTAGIGETTTRIDDAIAAAQRFMQRVMLGLEGAAFRPDDAQRSRWGCELSSFERWQAAQRRKLYNENWIHWEEAAKLSKSEGFQLLRKSLGADVSTLSRSERGQHWPQQSLLPDSPGKSRIPGVQAFGLSGQRNALDEGLGLLGTPDHSARPTWLAAVPQLAEHLQEGGGSRSQSLTPSDEPSDEEESAPARLLPGAEALDYIPLWIQAAVRLGTRFLRVAASGLPVAAPYAAANKASPCCVCKRDHAPVMDEYYFWLEDARRYDPADAPAPQDADLHRNTPVVVQPTGAGRNLDPRTREADPTSDWDAPTPRMLAWKAQPLVHLRWARVHMDVLLDPRQSTEGVPLTEPQRARVFLDLKGRAFDSLVFSLLANDATGVGFRYDMATDSAVVVPEAIASTNPPALPLPPALRSALTAFPHFLYFERGAPLVPVDTFSTSLVMAASLRADCKFEEASDWLRRAFDPLRRDNSWMQCEEAVVLPDPQLTDGGNPLELATEGEGPPQLAEGEGNPPQLATTNLFNIALGNEASTAASAAPPNAATRGRLATDLPCCPSAPAKPARARGRAATLEYLETLVDWAGALRGRNSLEASQQALTLLGAVEHVLGPRPERINAQDKTGGSVTISEFVPYAAPLNPRLMQLYYRTGDALALLRGSQNKQRLTNGELGRDAAHFGSHARFDAVSDLDHSGPTECPSSCCFSCCHPYRFTTVLAKALEWVALAKGTAGVLQSAIERADTEALSSLRLTQERQITELGLDVAKNAYRAADWDVQALDKQMAHATTRLQYFQRLIELGLNTGETAHRATTVASMASRTSATVVDGISQGMAAVPDMWVGIAGIAGTPLEFNQIPVGVKLGTGFATAARILNTVADISGTSAGLSLTQAGWDRREDDWQHTCDVTVLEIQQIKRQRLAARRRLDTALRELDNTQRRIEHAAEVHDFARDKRSRYELYLYLQHENATLYRQIYRQALDMAREAQQALRFELGDTSLSYVSSALASWESLHDGLVAGEKLELALRAMERAHVSKHCREYELTKHISLRLHFPAAFVLLKSTGYCEVDLPEWMYDLDYPGHFMRRIKAVSLTVPCVAGPYTGVHCKLQQLSSAIRFRPMRADSATRKCCPKTKADKEAAASSSIRGSGRTESPPPAQLPNDPHLWRRHAGTEAIATSTGQADAGLFELAFADLRYLPFEYSGAVSRWRIELPPENNQFDFDSLSDLVLHINYTAREGGDEFARQSGAIAQRHLPGGGWRFLDVRHELPEVWNVVRKDAGCAGCAWKGEAACGGECTDMCRCGREKHHDSRNETPGAHHGADKRKTGARHRHHDDAENDKGRSSSRKHDREHKTEQDKKKKKQKKRPAHEKREFRLSLTRDRFPFLTGRRGVAVTSVHLLLDVRGCGTRTAKIRFAPSALAGQSGGGGKGCVDTESIPLVPGEGGMLKGSLALKTPVKLDRNWNGRSDGGGVDNGFIGTFSLPCELRGVRAAWLLCGYSAEEKECCEMEAVGCCRPIVG